MKYWTWCIFYFLLASCFGQDLSQVSIISYNIRMDHSGDQQNNWHHRKSELASYLQGENADFIGLQEVMHHQLTFLDSALVDYDYLGVGRDDGMQAGEYSPIFYNRKKWEVVESNTFWLSPTPSRVSRGWDAACHRVCTYGLFVNEYDEKLLILNTHFDHVGNEARLNSLQLIHEFLESFSNTEFVITGDFNFTPTSDLYPSIAPEWIDTYTLTKSPRSAPTFNGFQPDKKAKRRIDYIFINTPEKFVDYQVHKPKTEAGRQLSDHYPIKIEITL